MMTTGTKKRMGLFLLGASLFMYGAAGCLAPQSKMQVRQRMLSCEERILPCEVTWFDEQEAERLLQSKEINSFLNQTEKIVDLAAVTGIATLVTITAIIELVNAKGDRANGKTQGSCCGCPTNYHWWPWWYGQHYAQQPLLDSHAISLKNLSEKVIPVKLRIQNNGDTPRLIQKQHHLVDLPFTTSKNDILSLYPSFSGQRVGLITALVANLVGCGGLGAATAWGATRLLLSCLFCHGTGLGILALIAEIAGTGFSLGCGMLSKSCIEKLQTLKKLEQQHTDFKNSLVVMYDKKTQQRIPLVEDQTKKSYVMPPGAVLEEILFVNRDDLKKITAISTIMSNGIKLNRSAGQTVCC